MADRIRVGIIGLAPGRSWASRAHVPALQSLADLYEVTGVANTSRASSDAAAAAFGIPHAFDNPAALAASPDVDMVSVTVRVPYHLELVRVAIDAGKHVYCEWPLGNGLAEGEAMADMARRKGVVGVAGTQARVAPAILHLRRLVADGYVGKVLSATVTARGRSWGDRHEDAKNRGYLLHRRNGATMLTIPFGHTLAAVRDVLGEFIDLSAIVTNRRQTILLPETHETIPFDAPDQVAVLGRIGDGAPITLHYRGGMPRSRDGLVWEINGTDGDLRLVGQHGGTQQVRLMLEGGRGDDRTMQPLEVPPGNMPPGNMPPWNTPPWDTQRSWPEDVNPGNVARLYARMAADISHGTKTAPTFDDAVELHKVIDAIERASASGGRVAVPAHNRPLPTGPGA